MIDAITRGKAQSACLLSLERKTLPAMLDVISQIALANHTNARFVRYLVSRSEKLVAAKNRSTLFAEVAATATKNVHDAGKLQRKLVFDKTKFRTALEAQAYLCTSNVLAILQSDKLCIDSLLEIKSYAIEVEARSVPRSMWKDPLWLVWNAMLQATDCRYIHDLYYLYILKLKRSNKASKVALLKHAMACCAAATYASSQQLDMLCGMEAFLKIHIALMQSCDGGSWP